MERQLTQKQYISPLYGRKLQYVPSTHFIFINWNCYGFDCKIHLAWKMFAFRKEKQQW